MTGIGISSTSILGFPRAVRSNVHRSSAVAERASAASAADEHLAGKYPRRGTELCTVVETMYSGSYTYRALGNNSIANLVERLAYNALPAALTSTTLHARAHTGISSS
jgi:hypothetical protein